MFKNTIYIPGRKSFSSVKCSNCSEFGHSFRNCASPVSINCSNCGEYGHSFKHCPAPVLSYGLLVFRFKNPAWSLESVLCSPSPTLSGLENSGGVEVLMICRRDSLRFVEFIRGKYTIKDTAYIKQLLENMVVAERELLLKLSFPELWNHVWGTSNPRNYRTDFEQSQEKFNELKSSGELAKLIAETEPLWSTPEWGFPKGRRNPNESDISCAIRECMEETGLQRQQLMVFDNVEPLTETFYGDNKVYYSHKYYPALVAPNTDVSLSTTNLHMSREIGDIKWLSIDEAMAKIRPDAQEKREILLRAANIFRSFCPFKNEKYFLRIHPKKQSGE